MNLTDSENCSEVPNDLAKVQQDDKNTSCKEAEDLEDTLKIVSWNINGMRTLNMEEILMKQLNDASIVLVQETKLASNLTSNCHFICNFHFNC